MMRMGAEMSGTGRHEIMRSPSQIHRSVGDEFCAGLPVRPMAAYDGRSCRMHCGTHSIASPFPRLTESTQTLCFLCYLLFKFSSPYPCVARHVYVRTQQGSPGRSVSSPARLASFQANGPKGSLEATVA